MATRKRLDDGTNARTIVSMSKQTNNLLTVSEAAAAIGVSRKRIHDYLQHGVPFANGEIIRIPKVLRAGRYDLDRTAVERIARRKDRLRGRPKKSSNRY
jgi:hypothetical protein